MNIYADRVAQLREIMVSNGWDAVVLYGTDPHSSEYPAPRWKQVEWLTGFTGEAGDLVVTRDHAGLWTDSRYFIQAATQLEGTGVELHKTRMCIFLSGLRKTEWKLLLSMGFALILRRLMKLLRRLLASL